MTPLEEERALQAKCKRVASYNPELGVGALASRLQLGVQRMKELLSERPSFPTSYKQIAGRLKKTVEEVAENKERGLEWCTPCDGWKPANQFYGRESVMKRHAVRHCVDAKRK